MRFEENKVEIQFLNPVLYIVIFIKQI